MKNLWPKLLIIAVSTVIGALILAVKPLNYGIDLSGGTILVYTVDPAAQKAGFDMDQLIAALKRRVNPDGALDLTIREVAGNRVEIILPNDLPMDVEDLKRRLTDVGSLEFRILASRQVPADRRAIQRVESEKDPNKLPEPPSGYKWAKLAEVTTGDKAKPSGAIGFTDATRDWVPGRYRGARALLTGKDDKGLDKTVTADVLDNTADTVTLSKPTGLASIASYRLELNPSGLVGGGDNLVVREVTSGPGQAEAYILYDAPRQREDVTGENLVDVRQIPDPQMRPAVGFNLDREGARRFGALTRGHLPRDDGQFKYHLAILLDGLVQSAPVINGEIRDSGMIEMGGRSEVGKEVGLLIDILKAGSLPATLDKKPLQEEKIGPTLGEDTVNKGIRAILISLMVVPIFMIVYYRFAGVVAVVCLLLNMLLLVALMALTGSSITLPGLAGLALTIGMAVDANVLIFERMREERDKGAALSQQIRNGYDRAWSTILDSNVTTILSGIVLWAVGTEEVKGFAVTLILGLVFNLFTAVFVSRVFFDVAYQNRWLKRLNFMQILGKTNIDFVRPRRICMVISVVLIAISLSAFFARGGHQRRGGMYNIDFTGGTLVTLRLNPADPALEGLSPSQRTDFVRGKAAAVLPDIAVESLNVEATDDGAPAEVRYNVRTTEDDSAKAQQAIREAFGTALARLDLKVGEPSPIPATAPAEPAADPGKADAPAVVDRFAGGRAYPLTLNVKQPPSRIAEKVAQVLGAMDVDSPRSRFEVVNPDSRSARTADDASKELVLRTTLEPGSTSDPKALLDGLAARLADDPDFLFERVENFGGVVAGEMRGKAIAAIVLSWVIMAAYLWLRFKSFSYGLAAVVALVHDVLIALGAVALAGYKIDLPMIAAFLTLIGFSVNDTIVIFDRLREIKGKMPHLTADMINAALNQTLSRTILTSLTAWMVVFIFWMFGGEGLAGFSFALVIGFLSGTYSTVYIASPILIEWAGRGKSGQPSSSSTPGGALATSR